MSGSTLVSRISHRHRVLLPATCRSSRQNTFEVTVEDILAEGCCISSGGQLLLSLHEKVAIQPRSFSGIKGKIRWLKSNRAGIEFDHPIDPMGLDRLLRMQSRDKPRSRPDSDASPGERSLAHPALGQSVLSSENGPEMPVGEAILEIYARGEFESAKAIWLEVVTLLLSKGILTKVELERRLTDIERATARLNTAYPQARQLLDATRDIRRATGLASATATGESRES